MLSSADLEDGTKVTTVMATSNKGDRVQMTFSENKVCRSVRFSCPACVQTRVRKEMVLLRRIIIVLDANTQHR